MKVEKKEKKMEKENKNEAWSIIPSDRLEGQGMKINEWRELKYLASALGCKHIQPCRKR